MSKRHAFWTKAFRTYYCPLCRRVSGTRLTNGDVVEAEEVSAEDFRSAIEYTKYPEAIKNLFAYLYVTARHIFIHKRRKENTHNMESIEGLLDAGREPRIESDVHSQLETEEHEAAYKLKRGPLTRREKTLLRLYFEGYACDEIAAIMNEEESVTRSDLNKVRAKVRYRLSNGK